MIDYLFEGKPTVRIIMAATLSDSTHGIKNQIKQLQRTIRARHGEMQ